MISIVLCYLCGITTGLVTPFAPTLLSWSAALVALLFAVTWRRLRLVACIAGFLCSQAHGYYLSLHQLPSELDNEIAVISGRVADFAIDFGRGSRIVLDSTRRRAGNAPLPSMIELRWYAPRLKPRPGDWCVFHVRLKRPHANRNPGSTNRELRWLVRGIGALGVVIEHPGNLCARYPSSSKFMRLRSFVHEKITAAVAKPEQLAAIHALAVADRRGFESGDWDILRRTGTTHLMAISGLHVSLAAAWAFFVVRFVAGWLAPATAGFGVLRAAWIAALLAGIGYVVLSGFGLPAQRAMVMMGCIALTQIARWRVSPAQGLAVAVAIIATIYPPNILSSGLWLSVAAVAILLGQHQAGRRSLAAAWRTHVLLAIGMAPLTALLFGAVSLVAPVTNLLAVPVTAMLVMPLLLAGILLAIAGYDFYAVAVDCAARIWAGLWQGLALVADVVPLWEPASTPGPILMLLLSAAVLFFVLPGGLHVRGLGLLLCAVPMLDGQAPLKAAEFRVTTLDVGHGTSVLVETANHALLYDAGPAWPGSSTDAGERIVIPALRRLGVLRLDRMVISHADSDHAGGAAAVRRTMVPNAVIVSPAMAQDSGEVVGCDAVEPWFWDGVGFSFIHPPAGYRATRNNGSCVLYVHSSSGSLLLPGDIEKLAEQRLIAAQTGMLAADVILVPHHGSATSSSKAFVRAVAPTLAIVSAARHGRFSLPSPEVAERYHQMGTKILNTAHDGAVSVTLHGEGIEVASERASIFAVWSWLNFADALPAPQRVW